MVLVGAVEYLYICTYISRGEREREMPAYISICVVVLYGKGILLKLGVDLKHYRIENLVH